MSGTSASVMGGGPSGRPVPMRWTAVKQRLDTLEDVAAMKQAQKTTDKKIEFILRALKDLKS